MKMFFRVLTAAVVLPAVLWAVDVERQDNQRQEGNQKNLAVQDIEFSVIQVQTNRELKDSVRVKIVMQRDQWKSLEKKNFLLEARFYVGEKRGQEKRIMDDKDYYLPSQIASYQFSPTEACPRPGAYWAKVWLSVRDQRGGANKDYKTYSESFPYVCLDRKNLKEIDAHTDFKLAKPRDRWTYEQLNLVVRVNEKQFDSIERSKDHVEVRLYTERDGHKYRVNKDKTYLLKQAAASYTFPIKQLCGEASDIWEEIFGKEVEVGCRLTVVDADGTRNHHFEEFQCPTEKVVCWN